jgi:hypothetical protein
MSGGAAKEVRDGGAAWGVMGVVGEKRRMGWMGGKVYISLNLGNSIREY